MGFQKIALTAVLLAVPDLAYAHLGHVGELAGHGHLIGLAGLAAAGAGAVLWGILKAGEDKTDNNVDETKDGTSADKDADIATDGERENTPAVS